MGKARVGVRLKEAVGNKKSINRSEDLDGLTQKFNELQQKQKNLIIALKTHHAAIGRSSSPAMTSRKFRAFSRFTIHSHDAYPFFCLSFLLLLVHRSNGEISSHGTFVSMQIFILVCAKRCFNGLFLRLAQTNDSSASGSIKRIDL